MPQGAAMYRPDHGARSAMPDWQAEPKLTLQDKLPAALDRAVGTTPMRRSSCDRLTAPTSSPLRTKAGCAGWLGGLSTPTGLAEVKARRDAAGNAIDDGGDGCIDEADDILASNTRSCGRFVPAWALRNEPRRLAQDRASDPGDRCQLLFAADVDVVSCNLPHSAAFARALVSAPAISPSAGVETRRPEPAGMSLAASMTLLGAPEIDRLQLAEGPRQRGQRCRPFGEVALLPRTDPSPGGPARLPDQDDRTGHELEDASA